MTTMARRMVCGVAILFLASALAGGPHAGTALACTCAITPVEREIKRSEAVFTGTVQSIDEGATAGNVREDAAFGGLFAATGRISFTVTDSWKGVRSETVEVYGQGNGANCYNVFEEGEAYVVYASRGKATRDGTPAPLENVECGATKPLAHAEKDLRLLGPPEQLTDTGGPPLLPAVVLTATTALSISVWMLLRWKRC